MLTCISRNKRTRRNFVFCVTEVAQSCPTICDPMDCTRLPCPSPTPGAYSNSCPLSRWCHATISSFVVPFSCCLQSFPASGSFPVSQIFPSCAQSIGVSASTSVFPLKSWVPVKWERQPSPWIKARRDWGIHQNDSQFSSGPQSCPTLCDPMDCSTPGLPVHHQLPEFTQAHVHRVGDAIQPSHPLSSPSPPALNLSQHQGLFQWVRSFHHVPKVLEFQLQHQSFHWIFRTDCL